MRNWKDLPFFASGKWERVLDAAHGRTLGVPVTPHYSRTFRAFAETSLPDVKVLILGQDPYPTEGVADGLAFSAETTTYLARNVPASLRNIHREYVHDLGYQRPSGGSLLPWARQGVLLLNTSLTCNVGKPASHADIGWKELVKEVLHVVAHKRIAIMLWGKHAQDLYAETIDYGSEAIPLRTSHPSPLSASKGFFGSRPFTRANDILGSGNRIDWRLP